MDTASYPDGPLGELIARYTIPVRFNILKDRDQAKALRAIWTPTVLFLDADGREQHRFLGFHPPREYGAVVLLASGVAAFGSGRIDDALACFDRITREFADTDPAPEATYWRGVCAFRKTKNTQPIYDACREVVQRYPNHLWAKKVGFVTRYKDFNNIG